MAMLKALVIGMGVLIAAGIAVVAVTLVNRMGAGAPSSFGRIELPPGARIAETHVDGKTVLLRLALADGTTRIAVYDLSGKLVSTIEVVETK